MEKYIIESLSAKTKLQNICKTELLTKMHVIPKGLERLKAVAIFQQENVAYPLRCLILDSYGAYLWTFTAPR